MSKHQWKFFTAGGFDQVKLDSGADLLNLDQLDQKLWVALACPTTGLEFCPKTAALIDTDKDGRIRAPELIAALKWAGAMLKNPDDLIQDPAKPAKRDEPLPLAAINDATPEGRQLAASAKQILTNIGKKDATAISVEDASDANKIFINTTLNGDGVIIPDSATDEATKAVINDILACLGGVPDRSGKTGIDQAKVDAFFADCVAFEGWSKQAEADKTKVLPVGEATAAAATAVKAIKAKVDDYFGRCRLAAFDSRAVTALNRKEEEYLAIAAKDLTITAGEIAGFPLAPVAAGKALPLKGTVNPAHAAALAALQADAVKPLLGDKAELTEADWTTLLAKLAPYETWSAGKAGAAVEKLGLKRVREILAGKAKENLVALIAKDLALAPEATAIANVEKLTLFVKNLHLLCLNFVNFRDFYDGHEPAIFQAGTLYLDQRSCTLTLPVADAGKHASMAALAGTYLAYCDCVRKGTGEKLSIVAAFTNGDCDNLMVGRNGLFYDRKGRDWDATITKIVENPISIRQAFWSPYKKLVRMIEEMAAKRAAAADAAADAKLSAAAEKTVNADQAKPGPKKVDVGTVAAISVAIAGIGALITSLLGYATGLFKLPFWQLCLAVVGLLLVISGPSMIIAWLKLRKRNIGPILDANGWAVNAKARINVPYGASLTGIARLPEGAVPVADRYGEKPSGWIGFLKFVIIVCFIFSLLNHFYVWDTVLYKATGKHYLPGFIRQEAVEKDRAAREQAEKEAAEAAKAATAPEALPAP
ncbi:MAG TPA: hypothetical protein PKN95_14830 [Verrucomicrobiota bacterium]|nr:hypothetical protein [Verrucomicrobiota bacterium]HNT16084.1 hypothetical protein [Verrucomicrobiota bacterium]